MSVGLSLLGLLGEPRKKSVFPKQVCEIHCHAFVFGTGAAACWSMIGHMGEVTIAFRNLIGVGYDALYSD